jgi:hypothetical protein
VPDAPISVAEYQAQRSSSTIGLTWSDGSSNGGLAVIDYRINQRVQGGSYSVIASGISTQSYTATGLTLGTIYEFTVEARNTNGHGNPSTDFTILHALIPETITTSTTTNSEYNVIIDWTAPSENGSTITFYTVTIRQSDETTYTEDSVNCDGSDSTIKSNT